MQEVMTDGIMTPRGAQRHQLKFRQLDGRYAVVRMAADAPVPAWAIRVRGCEFGSISRTPDELSIVCLAKKIPPEVDSGPRWICMKLEGPFSFSQIGVLLSFIEPLSNNGIPIFVISTYDTDYVLVQEEFELATIQILEKCGHVRIE